MTTVYDCFPYWKERWAAEARLYLWATLQPGVEYVPVAFAGDRTHRGNPLRPDLPGLPDGVERLSVTLDSPDGDWGREKQQRDAVYALKAEMDPEDLVIVADADEIADPRRLDALLAATDGGPCKLAMGLWYYGTRWKQPAPWMHAAACRARDLPPNVSDKLRLASLPVLPDAGWHLSWQGSDEDRSTKLSAFAHAEYDTADERELLVRAAVEGLDVRGKPLLDEPLTGPLADWLASRG